ncbi:MAG: MarR family winged helix-turn-helix transcriptional regulator [Vicinamibacteria bacterium]
MGEDFDLEHQIVVALRRIMRAVEMHSRQLAETFGLTAPQLLVLRALAGSGSMSAGELTKSLHLSQPMASEILDRLEEHALVDRKRSSVDKRRVECTVSAKGLELLEKSPPLLQERFVVELRRLSDWERSFLLAALQRVGAMMSADGIPAFAVLTSGPATTSAEKTADFLKERS